MGETKGKQGMYETSHVKCLPVFRAKHLHSWRVFECSSFLKSGHQAVFGAWCWQDSSFPPKCSTLVSYPSLIMYTMLRSVDHTYDALSRPGLGFVCAMWLMVEMQPEQETRPVEWLPCLMGLHNLPCSSVTNSRCPLVLMLSQFTLFSFKSYESWMNQKIHLARLVLKELESIFLLGFEQGTKPCSVCGEGDTQFCKEKCFAWWIWMCYLWLLSRSSAGAFQDFPQSCTQVAQDPNCGTTRWACIITFGYVSPCMAYLQHSESLFDPSVPQTVLLPPQEELSLFPSVDFGSSHCEAIQAVKSLLIR